jgi:hypothetical protein
MRGGVPPFVTRGVTEFGRSSHARKHKFKESAYFCRRQMPRREVRIEVIFSVMLSGVLAQAVRGAVTAETVAMWRVRAEEVGLLPVLGAWLELAEGAAAATGGGIAFPIALCEIGRQQR